MNTNHAERIVEWRKSLATLNDNQFFELIRMYLGEIKSPFNKQNLIQDLSSFLRKDENKKKIANLLSESDLMVIAAVKFIQNATQKKLTDFFKTTFTFSKLYERIINLEERLILYRHEIDGKILLRVNPHLDEIFDKIVTKSILIKEAEISKVNSKADFRLSPELLISFAAFVNENGDICKADGSFKKRVLSDIENRFPINSDILLKIKNAFENLSIIKVQESGKYVIDSDKFFSFAKLPESMQNAYICVASLGRFSRNSLIQQAKLLVDTALNIPEGGFTKENLLRSAYLKSERKKDNTGEATFGSKGRFAALLQKANSVVVERESDSIQNEENIFSILDRLLDTALELGILRIKGIEEDGTDVLAAAENLGEKMDFAFDEANFENSRFFSIDAAFNVMLFPGLPLIHLLDLAKFLELKHFDTAVSFEITKKSVMRGFDSGLSCEKILELLQKHCVHQLPQNLLISIEDWKKSYSSISVFKGYVLRVSDENSTISEKNPIFSSHIVQVLAPKIYLMDFTSDEEARKLLEASGSDFTGKIQSFQQKTEVTDFPTFYADFERRFELEPESDDEILTSDEERKAHFDYLRAKLKSMELSREEYECLLFRINRKIILDESQLKKESVKFAKLEATGMDFSGKVHIIEQAVTDKSLIEITFLSPENPNGIIITGTPISTTKFDDDVQVTIKIDSSSILQTYSISQVSKVRRIYGSSFK